jgi:hypothetical protein
MPRVCAGCGDKLRISGKDGPLWLDTFNRESWHFACKRTRLRNKPTNTPAIHVRISSEGVRVNVEGDHDQALELTRLLDQRPPSNASHRWQSCLPRTRREEVLRHLHVHRPHHPQPPTLGQRQHPTMAQGQSGSPCPRRTPMHTHLPRRHTLHRTRH